MNNDQTTNESNAVGQPPVGADPAAPAPMAPTPSSALKAFMLCRICNKESQVPLEESLHNYHAAAYMCPHCDATVHAWIRIEKQNTQADQRHV